MNWYVVTYRYRTEPSMPFQRVGIFYVLRSEAEAAARNLEANNPNTETRVEPIPV